MTDEEFRRRLRDGIRLLHIRQRLALICQSYGITGHLHLRRSSTTEGRDR
ncbi:hypothetical protein ACFYN3_35530 [Streptomyces lavendulae]